MGAEEAKGAADAPTVRVEWQARICPYPSDAPSRDPIPTPASRGGTGAEEAKGAADAPPVGVAW